VAACKEGISPSCHAFEFKGLLPHAILATIFFRYMYSVYEKSFFFKPSFGPNMKIEIEIHAT